MPYIPLPDGLPGISGAFAFRPETAKPMRELAHILLHEPNSLTPGERELIATYISSRNDCYFCQTSHGAAAAAHFQDPKLVQAVKAESATGGNLTQIESAAGDRRPGTAGRQAGNA